MGTLVEKVREFFKSGTTVDPGVPLEQLPFVVVDTELTGLDEKRDSVISIGAVKMSGTRIEIGRSFYRLMSPRADFTHESIVIHGITPDDVAALPALDAAAAELLEFCGDRVLVGHFFRIDLGFLCRESPVLRAAELRRRSIDTARLQEWIEGQLLRHAGSLVMPEGELNLVSLAQKYNIRVGGAHNALTDAFITAQVLQRQLRALPGLGVRTLSDLLRVGKP